MLMLLVSLCCGCVATASTKTTAGDPIAIDAEGYAQLQSWIDERIASGQRVIRIPPGTYRLRPVDKQHLIFKGHRDVKILAEGVEIIATQTTRVITISNCENVSISGLTVDFDPLPFTQGRIVEMSEDKLQHTIELDSGYPTTETVQALKYEIYHATEHRLLWGSYFDSQVEVVSPTRLIVRKHERYVKAGPNVEEVGDRIVIASNFAPGGSIPHAIYIERSTGTTLEDVKLYSSNMFGFFEWRSSASKYIRCSLLPRPLDTDPLKPSTARIRSGHADAFHSKHAKVGPTYIECRMGYMADDGIAINTDYHVAVAVEEDRKTLAVLAKRADELELSPGEELEIWSTNGRMLQGNRVANVALKGTVDEARRALVISSPIRPHWKAPGTVWISQEWTIQLDTEIPDDIEFPLFIASVAKRGDGAVIQNCHIGPTRSRGILVKSSNIEIRDNIIADTHGEGIKMAPEIWWLEAGHSHNVTITGNQLSRIRSFGIQIASRNGQEKFSPAGAHSNITIENNQFDAMRIAAIQVSSTIGLKMDANTLLDRSDPNTPISTSLPAESLAIDENTVEMAPSDVK